MRAAVLMLLAGCGRIGFAPTDVTDGATADVPDAAPLPAFDLALTGAPSWIRALAVTPDGALAIGGYVTGASAMLGSTTVPNAGGEDLVFGVVEATGEVRWSRAYGGAGDDEVRAISIAPDGTMLVTGITGGSISLGGAPLAPGAAFVASYTADGTHRWSVGFGGGGGDHGIAALVARDGDVLVGGAVSGIVDFGNGVPTPASSATRDGFVARWSRDGVLRWARRWGTGGFNSVGGLVEGDDGVIYAAGGYQASVDFGGGVRALRGSIDAFVLALAPSGAWQWDDTFGGLDYDRVRGLAIRDQTLVAVGYYNGTIDLSVPASSNGDAFAMSYSTTGARGWALGFGGPGCDQLDTVVAGPSGFVAGGRYTGPITLGTPITGPVAGSDGLAFELSMTGGVGAVTTSADPGDGSISGLARRSDGSLTGAGYRQAAAFPANCVTTGSGLSELVGSAGFVRSL